MSCDKFPCMNPAEQAHHLEAFQTLIIERALAKQHKLRGKNFPVVITKKMIEEQAAVITRQQVTQYMQTGQIFST